jgi:Bacterial Ig-like domain
VLNAVNFVPNAGATNCVFTDSSNTTVQCTPTDGLLGNQFYIMTITTAAKDEAGNPLAQLNAVSFNTGPTPDSTKPKMVSSQPSAATPVIDTNTSIAVYFSEAMDKVATQAAFTFISPALTASQSVSFDWNQNGNSLVIKRSPNFIHGETVTWKVGAGAKDVSGNTLEAASTGTHSFKIYTLGSFKLYSDGSLDGQANSKGVAQPHGDDLRTQAYSTFYTRGFISFDLQQLPITATLNTIKSATLNVYQQAVGCGGEYALLGNVLAENISYTLLSPLLFSTFFDTAPVSSGTTNVLATNSKVGYKTIDASQQVLFDVSHSNSLYNRSQWRLRFGQESNGTSQNCGDIVWAGGTGVQAERPYLNITYLHP